MIKSFILGAFTAVAHAQTDAQKEMYPQFTEAFGKYDIKWEPVEVTTDDGFILTLVHLTGDANGDW